MALNRIELDLYVYQGLENSFGSAPNYQINKSRIDTHTNITLEIGELVRDYLDITFNDDYLSHTRWVKAIVTYFKDGDVQFSYGSPQTFTYIATDGFGYFEDGTNAELDRNALMSSNFKYIPENTAGKIPIFAEGVGKVIIDGVTTQITDNGNTDQKIQYITVPQNSSTIQVYDTDDSTLLKTINVSNICEPKFTPYKITFVNKYGAFEDLYFFKKSTETLNTSDESFKRNTITNASSTYSTSEGQSQRFNVNGKTSLVLNTGFINEAMNETIEELFLSENVWIRYQSKTLPVLPTSKSLAFKTSLNDNLINYTINFDFAFDKINNVR
tara:strand:+ start:2689 stop:3672 length:984 start_codon:yes stop_codon:yes gene_type:complete